MDALNDQESLFVEEGESSWSLMAPSWYSPASASGTGLPVLSGLVPASVATSPDPDNPVSNRLSPMLPLTHHNFSSHYVQ